MSFEKKIKNKILNKFQYFNTTVVVEPSTKDAPLSVEPDRVSSEWKL